VLNNVIDRDIDQLMERTKYRPTALGTLKKTTLLPYAVLLGLIGTLLLWFWANALTTFIALIGLFFYVIVYSAWGKRSTVFGTLLGSVSGAIPPVVGYCAATNQFDSGAISLLLMLCFWQMPHSYAIAIFRLKDYSKANLPVLPVKSGITRTKLTMIFQVCGFIFSACSLTWLGHTGLAYLIGAASLGLIWLIMGISGLATEQHERWAKQMFLFSLMIIIGLSFLMAINTIPYPAD